MPTKTQVTKNLKLSEKLLEYLTKNPHASSEKNVSYIVISNEDSELNKLNMNLAQSLIKEGKKVIKALETKDDSMPWKFSTL